MDESALRGAGTLIMALAVIVAFEWQRHRFVLLLRKGAPEVWEQLGKPYRWFGRLFILDGWGTERYLLRGGFEALPTPLPEKAKNLRNLLLLKLSVLLIALIVTVGPGLYQILLGV